MAWHGSLHANCAPAYRLWRCGTVLHPSWQLCARVLPVAIPHGAAACLCAMVSPMTVYHSVVQHCIAYGDATQYCILPGNYVLEYCLWQYHMVLQPASVL